jgi:DNA-binding transcriptional LysR family regulator
MNVTFRQLRLFLALAETGSVSAAAKAMHVTQPTASMRLKELTQSVGLPLYEVIGRKIYLTEVGKHLADTARSVSQAWDSFEQTVDAMQGLSRGTLRVAVVTTAKYFMPRLVGSFCNRHPDIDVSLQILNRDGVVQRLRENLDDICIMSQPPADMDLRADVFLANPIVVIAAASDPLATGRVIPITDLARRRFIVREKGSGTRMASDEFFRTRKFRPDIRLELGSNEALKESVAGGLGIGLVSRHALHGLQREHGVAVIDVEGFPIPSAWHVVHPAGKKLSPLAFSFKQHLLAEIGRYVRDASGDWSV